ncbi:hypothetical protein OE88DRAFT_1329762 [Heliocybe sulcata]|uniref:Uncharacterized protein n=1 Tax=Heliocybe sulcata TaxID=5364 RepID=A0A5C3N954_9AGAM|nr:hypothetical protein OE88DRAFT_1329762 [Heliocybe sulcata]
MLLQLPYKALTTRRVVHAFYPLRRLEKHGERQLLKLEDFCGIRRQAILKRFHAAQLVEKNHVPSIVHIAMYNLRHDSILHNTRKAGPLMTTMFLAMRGKQPWSTQNIKIAQIIKDEGLDVAGF